MPVQAYHWAIPAQGSSSRAPHLPAEVAFWILDLGYLAGFHTSDVEQESLVLWQQFLDAMARPFSSGGEECLHRGAAHRQGILFQEPP